MRDLIPKIEHLSWVYALPVLSLFVCLLGVFLWAYSKGRKATYDRVALLPLEEER